MDKKKYNEILESFIDNKKRKNHSISTAEFMEEHARTFGFDPDKSYIAGLLHDIGKYIETDLILELADSYDNRGLERIAYFEYKKKHPFLLHGAASAEILLRKEVIVDNELILAIAHHTTGGPHISKFAQYTFICDFCEPERNYDESKTVRNILIKKKDFNKAYYFSYYYLIESLIKRKMEICLESIEGYNEILQLMAYEMDTETDQGAKPEDE